MLKDDIYRMVVLIKVLLCLILLPPAFLLYIVLGVVMAYGRQPKIKREYVESFNPTDCLGNSFRGERARVIDENFEALTERLKLIESAKSSIILSTFSFRSDESGKDILCALYAAAQKGVTVKIIADGAPAFVNMRKNKYFRGFAAMKTVEIKIYNPVNFFTPWKLMGRLHDKYVISDNRLYILGGRNTYDFFLGNSGFQNHDRDVLVYNTDPKNDGASVAQLKKYFDTVWNYKESRLFKAWSVKKTGRALNELEDRYGKLKRRYPEIKKRTDYEKTTFAANKITLLSNPVHIYPKEPTLFYALTEIMKICKSGNIHIHTPYVICNRRMYSAFAEICRCNPDTFLMTNSAANNGNPFGAADYIKNRTKLIATGLKIYEYEGGISYHGKSIAVGERLAVIGSFNMDMRSVYLDTELMLVIDSESVTNQLRACMENYESHSVKVLAEGQYEIPENVTRQKITSTKKMQIKILRLFSWIRFLT